jgi:16S rRNA (guanine527-N7)-methyltransferase
MYENIEFFIKEFNVSRETIEKLNKYRDYLLISNKIINLIGKSTEKHIYHRHFIDSAQIYNIIDKRSDIVDLGSGAGLPGLIIKLLLDNQNIKSNVILIEKSKKKSDFLSDLIEKLNLRAEIKNIKLEEYNFKNQSTVVARAFKKTKETLDLLYPSIYNIKEIILLKGKTYQQEIQDAEKKYTFNLKKFRSVTANESSIIKITDVKRHTT